MTYSEYFETAASGLSPYPYQERLVSGGWPELLNIPTGLGKTAAVTLAWAWKRGWRDGGRTAVQDADTPRRLVWCLPMRVLVEQTERSLRTWMKNLGILGEAGQGKVSVHMLMGGELDLKTWAEYPEEDMILIGTQDMLLSRALMRGYGMSRYQWPLHFALLHNDCLWAFDEVQLMGAGLATSAQLEAFRRAFPLGRSSRSLWLSATLNRDWLATVDLAAHLRSFTCLEIDDNDRVRAKDRLAAHKSLAQAEVYRGTETDKKKRLDTYLRNLKDAVLSAHDLVGQTLVVLNRVDRAQGLFRLLVDARPERVDLLIHARFRPAERAEQGRRLREGPAADRIVVSTQAIEAGVDISSKVLFTELAPWSSLVQRFGRCNRYGEHNAGGGAQIYWIDITDDADLLPYGSEALDSARSKLANLTAAGPDDLPAADEPRPLTTVLRRKDLLDLFNTDPDLSGFDVDVSDYIRDTGPPGLQVFWRDTDDPNTPEIQPAPRREELCPISIGQASGLHKRDVWRWDSLGDIWVKLDRDPRPGMTLMLKAADGGYDLRLGFMADLRAPVTPVEVAGTGSRQCYGADWRSRQSRTVRLCDHLGHATAEAEALCSALGETRYAPAVRRAGRWHDVGKAHPVFQKSMYRCYSVAGDYLAKSNCPGTMRHERRYFRHELASALAWLAQHDGDAEADLITYLIAAHHGKVRMSLRAMPAEIGPKDGRRFARGIWEGDRLPQLDFEGERSTETELRLALMEMGEGVQGPSWTTRAFGLLESHGPFRLAWLEGLVRLADWRASAAEQKPEEEPSWLKSS